MDGQEPQRMLSQVKEQELLSLTDAQSEWSIPNPNSKLMLSTCTVTQKKTVHYEIFSRTKSV